MSTLKIGGAHPSNAERAKLSVNFELQNALAVSRNLGILRDSLPGIQRTAIKTLRRRIFTEARRDIQREYNIGAARIAKDLRTRDTPAGVTVTGYFRGIGLRNFSARSLAQSGRGVSYSIFRGKRERIQEAFFVGLFRGSAPGANAHVATRGAPKRIMTAGRYKGKMRAPLVTEYGPTVAQMLRKGRRPERLADFAVGVLRSEVERLLAYYEGGRPLTNVGEPQ